MLGPPISRIKSAIKKTITAVKSPYRRIIPEIVGSHEYALKFKIKTPSDRYVFNEIFGSEDAYRRKRIAMRAKDGIVIEVGAHKGFFTHLAASSATRVIAFEPEPENFKFLTANIALNRMENIIAINKAVMDVEGIKSFTVSSATAARNTFFASTFSGKGRTVSVECTSLDTVFQTYEIERLALLKLDCEGSEYDILLNTDRRLLQKIDAIAMEIHETESLNHKHEELISPPPETVGFTADIYDERRMESLHAWMAFFERQQSNVPT